MENLENFIDVLPLDRSQKTAAFAPYQAVRQSWAAGDTLCRQDPDWISGNFSPTIHGAAASHTPSRIAVRALLFVKHAGVIGGRTVYVFVHC